MNLNPMNLLEIANTVRTRIAELPTWTGPTLAAIVLGSALAAVLIQRRNRTRTAIRADDDTSSNRGDTWLTTGAALLATGMSAQGMWMVAGDALHLSGPLKVVLFAFAEIALLAEARRAARYFAQYNTVGRHGRAVWGIAAGAGAISSLDADNFVGHLVRQAAPLLAAYLWHSGLIAALPPKAREERKRKKSLITWTINVQRILVALRLAEPGDRTVDEVDRARRLAKLARTVYRLHRLKAAENPWSWRVSMVERQVRRQVEAALEHLHLATDLDVRADLRAHLATLYQVIEGTSPDAVADIAPWAPQPAIVDADEVLAAIELGGDDDVPEWLSGSPDELWARFGKPVQVPVQRTPVQFTSDSVRSSSVQTLVRTEPTVNSTQVSVRTESAPVQPNPVQMVRTEPAAHLNSVQVDTTPKPAAPVQVQPAPVQSSAAPKRTGRSDDDELIPLIPLIQPFIAEFTARRGHAPGQAVTRKALQELTPPVRVGLPKAGRLVELATKSSN